MPAVAQAREVAARVAAAAPNNSVDDNGNGYKDCDDAACFSDATCIATDLSKQQMAGFTLCGKPFTFNSADSDAACQDYALSPFPNFTSKCQYATYSGTVTFYCAPKPANDAIGVRWVVKTQVPIETVNGKSVLWENLGGEFQFLSGGGSSTGQLHSTFDHVGSALHEEFVGYHKLGVKSDTKADFHQWFALWSLLSNAGGPHVAGGFVAPIDAAQLFGGT